MTCKHFIDDECRHAIALPLYGARPSAGVCAQCAHYDGPARGLGDRVHNVLGAIGVHKIVRDCGGCAARRAALNAAMPTDNA